MRIRVSVVSKFTAIPFRAPQITKKRPFIALPDHDMRVDKSHAPIKAPSSVFTAAAHRLHGVCADAVHKVNLIIENANINTHIAIESPINQ